MLKKYLNRQQKTKITKMYNKGVKINRIAKAVDEPIFVVKEYLESMGAEIKGQYCYWVHGHLQLTDYYNSYLHQYVVAKELGISIQDVKKYCVHHINQDKLDNSLTNLWLFFDGATHMLYHSMSEVGNSLDELYIFSLDQIEIDLKNIDDDLEQGIVTNDEYIEIKQDINNYMQLITQLFKKQKKILLKATNKQE